MIVIKRCFKRTPPEDRYDEQTNSSRIQEGQYACSWETPAGLREGVFFENALDFQKSNQADTESIQVDTGG